MSYIEFEFAFSFYVELKKCFIFIFRLFKLIIFSTIMFLGLNKTSIFDSKFSRAKKTKNYLKNV